MPDLLIDPGSPAEATPTVMPQEVTKTNALGRALPPLAKDLFPMGVRVISVQSLPPKTNATDTGDSSFNTFEQSQMLILLVPNESREVLSLALQQGTGWSFP